MSYFAASQRIESIVLMNGVNTNRLMSGFVLISLWLFQGVSASDAFATMPSATATLALKCSPISSSDPTIQLLLTNNGTQPLFIPGEIPISRFVALRVANSRGVDVQPGFFDSGMRNSRKPTELTPGQSIFLKDWDRFDEPRVSNIPLRLFGFTLTSGTYTISGTLLDFAKGAASNSCSISVP